jgi:hypothetical protein
MDRARIHEGIRRMGFEDVWARSERSELSQMEAAELLGITERTSRRTEFRALGNLIRASVTSARRASMGWLEPDAFRRGESPPYADIGDADRRSSF